MKTRVQETKGKVKEEIGRVSRDPDVQDSGTAEKFGRKVQRKVGEVEKFSVDGIC
jgi:uncharacterized protein YjbJ (UPF0337 family)